MIPFRPFWTALRRRVFPERPDRAVHAVAPSGSILFLGDSITEFWGHAHPELFAAHGFVNRGIGGETSGEVRARLALALAETRIAGLHLLCGINDIGRTPGVVDDALVRDNIAAMLDQARLAGVRTWIGSLTPTDILLLGSIDARPRIAALNAWLHAYAEQMGATYIDYHGVLAMPSGALRPEYSGDGLHLSPAGYAAMEPVLLAALRTGAGRRHPQAEVGSARDAPIPETIIPAAPQFGWSEDLHALQMQVLATLGDLDLVLVGDSLAQSWSHRPLWPWLTYSLGIGGDRTQHVLWRVERLAWGACRPERILVMAGTNNLLNGDAAPDIAAGVEAIAARLQAALPETRIFVMLPPPLGAGLRRVGEQRSALRVLLAARFGDRLIDADAALAADGLEPSPNYQADMVHLTERGYEVLTGLVRAAAASDPAEPGGPILLLGDSITEYWGNHRPAFFREHGVVCRGVGGETSGQVRARLSRALAETKASGLHVLCGINDIAHNAAHADDAGSRDNIAAMLAVAHERGVRTWVGSITPAEWLVYGSVDPRTRIAALNAWLRAHADGAGATYVDYHAVLATSTGALRPEYSHDGLHLSPAGYAAMEPILQEALRS